MHYQLRASDDRDRHLAVLTLDESTVSQPAADVIFDIVGSDSVEDLVASGKLAAGQVDDLKAIQNLIFDKDAEGLFIRNTVHFKANKKELDPDAPMSRAFMLSERDGIKYMRCDLTVIDTAAQTADALSGNSIGASVVGKGNSTAAGEKSTEEQIEDLSRVMFLHQIAIGSLIDVTVDNPELSEVIAYAEKEGLIDIDVKKAAYKLTEKGQRMHQSYIAEAQALIKRFDIYCDVDVDGSGTAHFDTGLGRDLRIAAFESEGVDPFRARFLLGLNDGEWDQLSNWSEVFRQESWYRNIFAPIESAPSIEEIGQENLRSIMDQAKSLLRKELD